MRRQCREWPEGAVNAEVESLIEEESRPGDAVIFTDRSVVRGTKSGWGYSARVNGQNVKEDSGAFQLTTSSMDMEVKAITQALRWLSTSIYKRAVVVTDSMSTLTKIQKGFLYSDWITTIKDSQIEKVSWIFCPGHASVKGNERADQLAGEALVQGSMTLDPPTVLNLVKEMIASKNKDQSHTLQMLIEKDVQAGEGRKVELRGQARRITNQLMMSTISRNTLKWTLQRRGEEIWTCSDCKDPDSGPK